MAIVGTGTWSLKLEPETWNLALNPGLELGNWNLELGHLNLDLVNWNWELGQLGLGSWDLGPGT